jgi:AcrR family transcriptional regulator
MLVKPRNRKSEQAAATRRLLLEAARALFTEQGYAGASIDEIAGRAGVTIGALYHHFRDKKALFRAVYEDVEAGFTERIVEGIRARTRPDDDAWERMRTGAQAYLDACMDAAIQQIVLLDAPVVLGGDGRLEIARYGLGLVRQGLQLAMDHGLIARRPIEPLAHVMRATITEGALLLARSPNPEGARAEVGDAVDAVIGGMRLR